MGLRSFTPQVSACPGCGRTTSTFFQEMAQQIQGYLKERMPAWRETYPGVEVIVITALENGAKDFMTKPFTQERLVEKLKRLVEV